MYLKELGGSLLVPPGAALAGGEAGGLLNTGSETTGSKAHRGEKQRELRCNSKFFISIQGKVQRFPHWPTALAIRKEQVRDGGTHL